MFTPIINQSFPKGAALCSYLWIHEGFPGGGSGKEPTYQCRLDVRDTDAILG